MTGIPRDRPTRLTSAGRAYLDLQSTARASRRDTGELLQIYALEGFLARLSTSRYAERFVLKGGLLLTAFDARRPTRDIDMAAVAINGELEHLLQVTREIAATEIDDGLRYDHAEAAGQPVREEAVYGGVRISMPCHLDRARMRFQVDINVGDPIWPAPRQVQLPRLLGGSLQVLAYPIAMVLAEKIVTAVQRGQANTRWRDFVDIYLLSQLHDQSGQNELTGAVHRVADNRHAQVWPLASMLTGYAALNQQRWLQWRRRQRLDDGFPRTSPRSSTLSPSTPILRSTAPRKGLVWSRLSRKWIAAAPLPSRDQVAGPP